MTQNLRLVSSGHKVFYIHARIYHYSSFYFIFIFCLILQEASPKFRKIKVKVFFKCALLYSYFYSGFRLFSFY